MSIKVILSDLSEVYFSGIFGVDRLIGKYTNITSEEFRTRLWSDKVNTAFRNAMRNKITKKQFIETLLDGSGWDVTVEQMDDIMSENLGVPVVGSLDIVRRLKGEYRLVLLSDYVPEWEEYIRAATDIAEVFDEIYFSHDIGMLKTDPGTFEYILKCLEVEPDEVLFIDDLKTNIEVAHDSGIKNTIRFKNAEQLFNELRDKFGIVSRPQSETVT